MAHGKMNDREARTQQVFTALMWALSYPGQIQTLPENVPPFLSIGETLVDLETSYYTTNPELDEQFARLGARSKQVAQALYQFYPRFSDALLPLLQNAPVGTYLSPDSSATLVLGATIGSGYPLRLTGPGIQQETILDVNGISPRFWELRKEKNVYPMGWDIFLVQGNQVVGLPRTTQVEVGEWHM